MRIAAERIGIVKLGAIGDVVNTLPFVHRLRLGHPAAHVTWIIGPAAHALVEGHAAIDRFLVLDVRARASWPAFLRELRAARLDLAIDLQRILKSGIVTRASGAPLRLGFDRARCKEGSWIFTNHKLAPNPRPGVTVEQYLEFADWLECPPSAPRWDLPYLPFDPPAGERARIVVNVGASKPANRWPTEAWRRLCALLVDELGAEVHLTGGAVDRAVAAEVRSVRPAAIADHAGALSLKGSAGLIRSAQLFVGGDTGPLHVAAAVGTPAVALFGAADPARTGPYGAGHVVVTNPVPCSPCRRRTCNVPGHPCMTGLAPELVLARVRALLRAPVARR
jgi:ADP-heptose:LPS heptosyltransferase